MWNLHVTYNGEAKSHLDIMMLCGKTAMSLAAHNTATLDDSPEVCTRLIFHSLAKEVELALRSSSSLHYVLYEACNIVLCIYVTRGSLLIICSIRANSVFVRIVIGDFLCSFMICNN